MSEENVVTIQGTDNEKHFEKLHSQLHSAHISSK